MRAFLEKIIVEAGEMALEYYTKGVTVTTKSHETDIVTEADKAVSDFLIEKIATQFPDHGILSEESTDGGIHQQASIQWIMDPIDGTRNFAAGLPSWATMIAVIQDGVTIHTGVYFPMTKELFLATKGEGATANGVPMRCSQKQTLQYALGKMFVTEPAGVYGTYYAVYKKAFHTVISDYALKIREFGCSAALCYVAKGSIDFAFGNSGLDWDYLPTFLICQEAGLIVTDCEGNPWVSGRQDYVISNSTLHPQLLSYFKQ
jgi:myo-inositol-1(or 4)-monophosphatase